jgi:hypothetical protein
MIGSAHRKEFSLVAEGVSQSILFIKNGAMLTAHLDTILMLYTFKGTFSKVSQIVTQRAKNCQS